MKDVLKAIGLAILIILALIGAATVFFFATCAVILTSTNTH